MKVSILIIFLITYVSSEAVKMTSRTLLRKRLDKYYYVTNNGIENKLNKINKIDQNELNEVLTFEENPEDVTFMSGDQVCISNTFFSLLFTILTFSSACSVIVAC